MAGLLIVIYFLDLFLNIFTMSALTVDKNYFVDRATRIYNAWVSYRLIFIKIDQKYFNSILIRIPMRTSSRLTVSYFVLDQAKRMQHIPNRCQFRLFLTFLKHLYHYQTWLFNCSLPDTLLILTRRGIYFLGSDRKAQFFSPLESKENLIPPFTVLTRNKADKDKENFDKLLRFILDAGKKCGYFAKEKPHSEFAKSWDAALKEKNQVFYSMKKWHKTVLRVKFRKEEIGHSDLLLFFFFDNFFSGKMAQGFTILF